MKRIESGLCFASSDEALCWAAEVQMASDEDLASLKGTAVHRKARAHRIACILAVAARRFAGAEAVAMDGPVPRYPRLRASIEEVTE